MRIFYGFNQLMALLIAGACLGSGALPPDVGDSGDPETGRPGGARGGLRWPLEPPLGLRAAFGEFREGGRVHGGLDLSTGGRTGLPVLAVADGEVFQLKVEWRGYGRAIYQRLRDGRIAVYAHLESFVLPGLEEAVGLARRRRGRYPGDIPLRPPRPVRQGEVLARSGESGAGLPHLHFEIRGRDNRPADPLQSGLPVALEDSTSPVFESLWIFAARPGSWVQGAAWQRRYEVRATGAGDWESEPVRAAGAIDLAIEAHDATPDGSRLGIPTILLRWDGREISASRAGGFGFEQARRAAAIHDGDLSHLSPTRFFYRPLAPRGSPWQIGDPPGALEGLAGSRHALEIEMRDAVGNAAILRVPVEFAEQADLARTPGGDDPLVAGATESAWQVDPLRAAWLDGRVALPLAGSGRREGTDPDAPAYRLLHDPTGRPLAAQAWADAGARVTQEGRLLLVALPPDGRLRFEPVPGGVPLRAVQKRVGSSALELACGTASLRVPRGAVPRGTPVTLQQRTQPAATEGFIEAGAAVRIEPAWRIPALPLQLRFEFETSSHRAQRLGIYRWDGVRERWVHAGGTAQAQSGRLEVALGDFGTFRLLEDAAPPQWGEQRPAPGQQVPAAGWTVTVGLEDGGSGIDWDGAGIRLDGRELEAEFDPDRKKLEGLLDRELAPGRHRLEAHARDRAGNQAALLAWQFSVE